MENNAAGPGTVPVNVGQPDPLLWGATDSDVIGVFNPLSVDFIGLIGNSKPVNMPFEIRKTVGAEAQTKDEAGVSSAYGLSLKNPDHFSPLHITSKVTLPAGKTTSLMGGTAKVIVNQLVNEIMQREGESLKMGDPTARLHWEQRIVRSQGNVIDLLPQDYQTPQDQVNKALEKVNNEAEFPTETQGFTRDAATLEPAADTPKRGRPPKNRAEPVTEEALSADQ